MVENGIFHFQQASSPVLVSFPHDGVELPADIAARMNDLGRSSFDTDWLIRELYNFLPELNVSWMAPKYSRFVVDLNRAPKGGSLYPGQYETSVCPVATFDGQAIYSEGEEPNPNEVAARVTTYWQPYHQHLQQELERIKAIHGYAILWEAHSIRGVVPNLFDGVLPALNFGTSGGHSCAPDILRRVTEIAQAQSDYSVVINERFKGGYITRHYGNPAEQIHCIQLEINQSAYMKDEVEPALDAQKCARLRPLLKTFIESLAVDG